MKNTIIAVKDGTSPLKLIDKSKIHTAEFAIHWREGLDVVLCRNSQEKPELISNWHTVNSGKMAKFTLNPNHAGGCNSLTDFEQIVARWAQSESIRASDMCIGRCDYAFDSTNKQTVDIFVKVASLVYFAFLTKHQPRKTDRKRFEIADDFTFTGYLGRKKGYAIQIDLYDKQTQKPKSDTLWRFEIRYIETSRNRHKSEDAKGMLEAIITELESLKSYYHQAQDRLSFNLAQHFNRLQQGTQKRLSKNQHLFTYNDRVFSRYMIKKFFKLVLTDADEQTCDRRTNDFSDEYDHLFISQKEFEAFINEMISNIQHYIEYPTNGVLFPQYLESADMSWLAKL